MCAVAAVAAAPVAAVAAAPWAGRRPSLGGLCHGDGGHAEGARRRRALMLPILRPSAPPSSSLEWKRCRPGPCCPRTHTRIKKRSVPGGRECPRRRFMSPMITLDQRLLPDFVNVNTRLEDARCLNNRISHSKARSTRPSRSRRPGGHGKPKRLLAHRISSLCCSTMSVSRILVVTARPSTRQRSIVWQRKGYATRASTPRPCVRQRARPC